MGAFYFFAKLPVSRRGGVPVLAPRCGRFFAAGTNPTDDGAVMVT